MDGSDKKNQYGNIELELYFRPNEPNRHIENVLSNSSTIHILLMCHRIFSRTEHMLGHKTHLNNFKKTEIISGIFSDHNGMKPEINNRRKIR